MAVTTLPRGLRLTVVGSALAHAGVVVGLVVATSGTSHPRSRTDSVITTKLVRLGKERPKDLLPRKEAPPPPPKPVNLASEDAAAVPAKATPSVNDRLKELSRLSGALDRINQESEEEPEGMADGATDGEVTNLAQALVGNRYVTEIYNCVKKYYVVEGIPASRLGNREATVFVRVNGDGTLFDYRVEKSSGLAAMDRAVEHAIKRCGKVSPPPREMAQQVRSDGIEFVFVP
jgi:colicin import membrane protein/protein TonB